MAPVDAPMIAAGLPSQALSPCGREAQSIAFFNTPSIVFRRNKQNSIHLAYPSFQLSDFGRRILLLVLVKRRNAIKLERFDSCVFRRKLGCSPQRRDCMIRAADCRRYRGYELVSSFAIPSLEEFQLLVTGHTLHVTAYQAVALMPVRLGPKAGHFL